MSNDRAHQLADDCGMSFWRDETAVTCSAGQLATYYAAAYADGVKAAAKAVEEALDFGSDMLEARDAVLALIEKKT